MAAFDSLPRELRRLIAFGPFFTSPLDAANALRAKGGTVQKCITAIRLGWRGTPGARAHEWRKAYGTEYPHVAARATVRYEEPDDYPPDARSRLMARRHVARLRAPPPAPIRERERPALPKVIAL
jgi:hypothetical protein